MKLKDITNGPDWMIWVVFAVFVLITILLLTGHGANLIRSEERRVGKEC